MLTLALDSGWLPAGYMMWWDGPADGVRPLSLSRPFPVGRGRQQGLGNWPRFIVDRWACRVTGSGAGGLQRLVAKIAQHVIAALQKLARDRHARAIAADPLGELVVVGTVGAAGTPGGLRGFIERPAQRGWSLARQVPGSAVLIGLV